MCYKNVELSLSGSVALRPLMLIFAGFFAAVAAEACAPARAQIILPGASEPTQSGAAQRPVSAPKPKPKPAAPRAASEESVIGRPLQLNGTKGRITIERHGAALEARVLLSGDQLSKPTEACGVDLGGGAPLPLTPAGRPEGVLRYQLAFAGCPIVFDILDGAVLASGVAESCRFTENDCRADPRGMWGPPAAAVEGQAAAIEAERGAADKSVRASFKQLLAQVQKSKDKVAIRTLASEQAGFTSRRDITCRDYQREAAHGFCSARYTELRAANLSARLGVEPAIATASTSRAVAAGGEDGAAELTRQPKARPAAPKINLGTFQ